MREQEALELLDSLKPDVPSLIATTGMKKTGAYLLLTNAQNPDRWAVVYTPGDRYFSLQSNDLFGQDYFSEDLEDDEVKEILENYLRIGLAYAQGSGEIVRSGFLRRPVLVVQVGNSREELHLSVAETIASFFRPPVHPARNSR